MLDKLKKRKDKPEGAPPGTLIHTGEVKTEEVRLDCHIYGEDEYELREKLTIEEIKDWSEIFSKE